MDSKTRWNNLLGGLAVEETPRIDQEPVRVNGGYPVPPCQLDEQVALYG